MQHFYCFGKNEIHMCTGGLEYEFSYNIGDFHQKLNAPIFVSQTSLCNGKIHGNN